MKFHTLRPSKLTLAVQAAVLAMTVAPVLSLAQSAEELELTHPTSTFEIGVGNGTFPITSAKSLKYGEYTGLTKSNDAYGILNLDMRGGPAYDNAGSTYRWSLKADDVGTTARSLSGTAANQGSWNINLGYDELRHTVSTSYMTPYVGDMGRNSFVLPATFGLPASTAALTATQLGSFHPVDVYTNRNNSSVSAGLALDSRWSVQFDFNRLEQNGAKLMGFGSMGNGAVGAEAVSILPNPTNYQTDTINLGLNWLGDKANFSASYSGSIFSEKYDRVTWNTFNGASQTQVMSTMPSNAFHQLNFAGGYAFSPKTKLTASLSWAKNTQDDPYVYDGFSMVATPPKGSLDGLVESTHLDVKLVDQTSKDLQLSAAARYDERYNRTESKYYALNALDGSANHVAIVPNTPLSTSKAQLEFAGDYRLAKDQRVRVAYTREDINRWCSQYASGLVGNGGTTATTYVNGVVNYPAGTNCVVARGSVEEKLAASYKFKASDDVNLNAGISFADRKSNFDPNAITARIGTNGNVDPTAAAATLIRGINSSDFRGFYPWFAASRLETLYKVGGNWQASERMNLGASAKYTDDRYNSAYGVTNGNSWSLNLDSSYTYSDTAMVTAYITQQHRQRDLVDKQNVAAVVNSGTKLSVPPNSSWSDKLTDDDTTVGISAKQSGYMGGKLELIEDLSYSMAWTGYATQLNYPSADTVGRTCNSTNYLTCGTLPNIRNELLSFKLTGNYKMDKKSKISVAYLFQQLGSDDYYFNGLQNTLTPTKLMPTNQQAPSYTVNAVFASYIYSF